MNTKALLALTGLNLGLFAGSAALFFANTRHPLPEPDAAAAVVSTAKPAAAGEPGVEDTVAPRALTPPERDIRFAELVAEVFNLRGEVEALKDSLGDADSKARPLQSAAAGSAPAARQPTIDLSPAEEFSRASGSGDGLENISTAFYSAGAEYVSSSCQGNMCRVSYDIASLEQSQRRAALRRLTHDIASSVGGNVDIVFAQEGGESVIYVKRVE